MESNSLIINLRDISFSYSQDKLVLDHLSFQLHRGDRIGLVGPNGSGKTTLLHIIIGLLRPSSGRVELFGKPANKEKDFRAARKRIGLLFQDADDQLFSPTVLEDVAFGPRNLGWSEEQVDAAVKYWLKIVGLPDISDYSPYELSFGQKKRAALAGVFVMNPKVVLLDEPFAYLDLPSTITLIQLLTQIVEDNNVTVVFSSHDYSLVEKWADRMIVLNGGYSIFCGDSRIGFQDEALTQILGDPAELDNLSRKPKVSLMTNQKI